MNLELACLSALARNRDRWKPSMVEGVFSRDGRDLREAILEVDDPTDPLQLYDFLNELPNAGGLIAQMLDVPPLHEDQVQYRLEQLLKKHHAERIRAKVDVVMEAYKLGDVATGNEIALDLMEMATRCDGLVGGFQKSRCLDDPAPLDEEQRMDSIVRGFLYPGGMSVLAGDGGLGKSWLAIYLGLCVAQGDFWLGMQCKPARSVGYLCLEMPGRAVRQRVRHLTGGKLEREARKRFHYITREELGRAVDILDENFRMGLASWIQDKKLNVLIVDPLMNAHHLNENKTEEIGRVLRAFSELGCAILLLHHVSKGDGTSRGSSAIKDWADAVMTLSQDDDQLWLGWQKRSRFDAVGRDIPIMIEERQGKMEISRTDVPKEDAA